MEYRQLLEHVILQNRDTFDLVPYLNDGKRIKVPKEIFRNVLNRHEAELLDAFLKGRTDEILSIKAEIGFSMEKSRYCKSNFFYFYPGFTRESAFDYETLPAVLHNNVLQINFRDINNNRIHHSNIPAATIVAGRRTRRMHTQLPTPL